MDIYFRYEEFTEDVARKYLSTCVVVDLVYLGDDYIRIWVNTKFIDVSKESLFCKKVETHLNAHYYDYANHIDEYKEKIGKQNVRQQTQT